MLHADGKVVTPLYESRLGEEWVDKKTEEIKQVRYEPDADLHFEATGEAAFGTKLVAPRSEEVRGRIISTPSGYRRRASWASCTRPP
jgi:hypothetical protein